MKGAEVIVILKLVTVFHKRSRNIRSRKITIGIDNPKVYKGIVNKIYKVSYFL